MTYSKKKDILRNAQMEARILCYPMWKRKKCKVRKIYVILLRLLPTIVKLDYRVKIVHLHDRTY